MENHVVGNRAGAVPALKVPRVACSCEEKMQALPRVCVSLIIRTDSRVTVYGALYFSTPIGGFVIPPLLPPHRDFKVRAI